ncbi:uncharacterized protein BDR25DRAFT_305394 [Lindgomyces ingoldianus]|uniref:Uncharacterized protein n=1 Tax=Lindgomyces ingoldianus TaxID=673940 RepID=A0ACB6QL39_9PLEO|nr:uncharacterized protein BDR25DRAFT_305394 [Lindgomyces ingoldianus]KAF2467606.1 hypothetical protein BDR25DRAFT_305394 [Lindgomyces ingoldianus]
MLFSTILLSLCALAAAHPPYHKPSSTSSIPFPVTCPASTPYTTVYVTTVTQTISTTALRERNCPSFYTEVDTPAPWSTCTFNTNTCTRQMCLMLSTITQPCITDKCCTRTATDTSYQSCPTKCPEGCGTSWTVVSASCTTTRPVPTVTVV